MLLCAALVAEPLSGSMGAPSCTLEPPARVALSEAQPLDVAVHVEAPVREEQPPGRPFVFVPSSIRRPGTANQPARGVYVAEPRAIKESKAARLALRRPTSAGFSRNVPFASPALMVATTAASPTREG